MIPEFYTREYANEQNLILLTQWCNQSDLPTLYKFQAQVLKDKKRTAVIVQDYNVFALAVDKVSGSAKK